MMISWGSWDLLGFSSSALLCHVFSCRSQIQQQSWVALARADVPFTYSDCFRPSNATRQVACAWMEKVTNSTHTHNGQGSDGVRLSTSHWSFLRRCITQFQLFLSVCVCLFLWFRSMSGANKKLAVVVVLFFISLCLIGILPITIHHKTHQSDFDRY